MLKLIAVLWATLALKDSFPITLQRPDSTTTLRYTRALKGVDDSLTAVRGAMAGFRADLATASPALVRARSARVQARCVGARTALDQLQSLLATSLTPHGSASQQTLRTEGAVLARALQRCEREWNAGPSGSPPDSLRAWGPYRIQQLEDALRRYDVRARAFRNRTGMK